MKRQSLATVIVDTMVQPKAIAHPTDSRLLNRAREQLVAAAQEAGIELRQSYARVGKAADAQAGRYAHANGIPGSQECQRVPSRDAELQERGLQAARRAITIAANPTIRKAPYGGPCHCRRSALRSLQISEGCEQGPAGLGAGVRNSDHQDLRWRLKRCCLGFDSGGDVVADQYTGRYRLRLCENPLADSARGV